MNREERLEPTPVASSAPVADDVMENPVINSPYEEPWRVNRGISPITCRLLDHWLDPTHSNAAEKALSVGEAAVHGGVPWIAHGLCRINVDHNRALYRNTHSLTEGMDGDYG
jgi:hypothetical protein